jgi:hypothetical protein
VGANLEKISEKGLVFSVEAIAGLAIVLVLVATVSFLSESPSFQPNTKEWQQTNAIITAQTNRVSNSTPMNYQGPQDYYCYRWYDLNIDSGRPRLLDANHCEATP